MLDLLAVGAGYGSFEDAVDAAREGTLTGTSATWLRELGRVAYQAVEGDNGPVSVEFFEAARRMNPSIGFREVDSQAYLEAKLLSAGSGTLQAELPQHRKLAALDRGCFIADMVRADYGAPSPEWVAALNSEIFEPSGASPIKIHDGEGELFDRLGGTTSRRVEDGPLVTVVMATYRRREEISVAIRSILNQTWANLELIVVDDASGPDFDDILAEIESWDSRIKIVRMPTNGGAYVARNTALQHALGEFITFQDDDDWSHPERIERQLEPLRSDPDIALTLSLCVRATEDLSFRYRGAKAFRRNASSLMFRRTAVDSVGLYDTVRKAADSEYIERLIAVTGGRREVVESVLSVVRLSTASLSRADFGVGWHHPARDEYRESYQSYHRELRYGRVPVLDGTHRRQFPAPRRFLGDEASAELPTHFDVAVASDWRYVDAGSDFALQLLRTELDRGTNIGIIHLPDFRNPGKGLQALAPEIRQLLMDKRVTRILADEVIEVENLVVDDAARLQLAADERWAISVEHAFIVAVDPPIETHSASTWSFADVDGLVQRIFAPKTIRWVSMSDAAQHGMSELSVAPLDVDPRPLGLSWGDRRLRRGEGSELRVGTWVSTHPETLPVDGLQELDDAATEGMDIRVFAMAGPQSRMAATWPAEWLVYGPTDISFTNYLQQLDVLIVSGESADSVSVEQNALRAANAGCVVIADRVLETRLGEAALYCDVAEVHELISSLRTDPAAYDSQVNRAIAWCESVAIRKVQNEGLLHFLGAE